MFLTRYRVHCIRNGFSLIELLLTVAVISMLAGTLLPALGKTRERARQTVCASNLKQISLAFTMYLQDYEEIFPCAQDPVSTSPFYFLWMGRGWRELLAPYITSNISALNPSVLYCPSDRTAPRQWESTSYAYSMAFYHSKDQINMMNSPAFTYTASLAVPGVPQKLSRVRFPDKKILAAEWLDNHETGQNDWWSWNGAKNCLFADGHVSYLKAADILPANDGFPDPNLTVDGIGGRDIE